MKIRFVALFVVSLMAAACGQVDDTSHVAKEPRKEYERDVHKEVQDARSTPMESHYGDSSLPEDNDRRSCPFVQSEVCSELRYRAQQGLISHEKYLALCKGPASKEFRCTPRKPDSGW